MVLLRFSFYLSILLCTSYIAFCANDGGNSQNNKLMKKVDLDLFGIVLNDNDYFNEVRKQKRDAPPEIAIKKPFTIKYFAHFFAVKFESTKTKYTFLYSFEVCDLINDKRDKSKIPDDFFPRLMVKELFPKINSCEFKAGSTFVNQKDTLWLNPKHQTSITFPKEKEFNMVINIGKEEDKNDPENSYVLSSLWTLYAGPLIDALEHIKSQMIKTVNIELFGVHVHKNDYFGKAPQQKSDTQEIIIIKKSFTIEYFAHFFEIQFEDNGRKTKFKPLYSFKVCDLINDKRDKSKVPDDFFPRQMLKELFPKINSCEFKAGSSFVNPNDTLRLNPDHQTGVVFPKDNKFNMVINIGKQDDKNDPENSYLLSSFWIMQTFK